ncbi:MAG: helix-turn-helix domain-containing protein, partial [Halobacteriales archaeon]|nr:helix-turn-helix domain-containing protein [Halobacteriales archaeon]
DEVVAFDPIGTEAQTTLVQIETTNPRLLTAVLSAGVPLQTPFEVRAGRATWRITTSSDRLSALGDRLNAADIDYDLESLRNLATDPTDQLLTDRQREVFLMAYEMGYYATPRRATLTAVAESLDVSKATASDVLHRAEGRIMDWIVDEFLVPQESV